MNLFDFSNKAEVIEIPVVIIQKTERKHKDIVINNTTITKIDYRKGLYSTHQYYSQFVTLDIIKLVVMRLGTETIIKSSKHNFSDIRQDTFDSLDGLIHTIINKQQIIDAGEDIPFLCFNVCVAIAAATKFKESYV